MGERSRVGVQDEAARRRLGPGGTAPGAGPEVLAAAPLAKASPAPALPAGPSAASPPASEGSPASNLIRKLKHGLGAALDPGAGRPAETAHLSVMPNDWREFARGLDALPRLEAESEWRKLIRYLRRRRG